MACEERVKGPWINGRDFATRVAEVALTSDADPEARII